MSQHPANNREIQRWAAVLTVEQLAVIRTGEQYRKMILTARSAHAAAIGLPALLCCGMYGWGGFLVLVVPYLAGIVALVVVTNVYGRRAGLPLYPLSWRVKRIIQRDRWNLTWWSGPPPPLHPWSGRPTSGNVWW